MQALFELNNVVKTFQGRDVLRIGGLEMPLGGITAIQGPNGAGKTTLLHILAALDAPDSGGIIYRGKPIPSHTERLTEYRRRVTLVHQDPYLFNATVEKNLAYGLKLRGASSSQRAREAARALDMVGLGGFAGRRARRLSQGESRRVALARALALRPETLLLDEPFANLDEVGCRVFEQVISELPANGCDVVLVTHGREQARRLADHVFNISQGRMSAG